MKVNFNENEKKILSDDLNKLQRNYLDYLEEYDDDEETRYRLYVVSWLKNLITTNRIDEINWNDDDDTILIVNVD